MKERCQQFTCGDDEFHEPINEWIREGVWQPDAPKAETLAATDGEDGPLVGFATWRYANPQWATGPPPKTWKPPVLIRIVWFALDVKYHGETTTTGGPLSLDFYNSVEQRALRGPKAEPEMFVETFCHYQNEHALAWWIRQFADIGPAIGRADLRRLIRLARLPPEPAPDGS